MNKDILQLAPSRLWHYFSEILAVPRPSKKEEKIIAYLVEFGKNQQLETLTDEIGNVLIRKPATPGYENKKTVVLQSHIDMVCEKNSDVDFDFEKDTIQSYIEDGWVKAKGTTLGADDGIGIATQMAILEAKDIEHGPIECLFTVDEETGLTGAFNLKEDWLDAKILLNLDSEDDGELFIGCAGGVDTLADFSFEKEEIPEDYTTYKISITGLKGGHSGDEIHKGLANANKLMTRIIWGYNERCIIRVADFDGGNLRNAIAREAFATVMVPEERGDGFVEFCNTMAEDLKNEFRFTEPDMKVQVESAKNPAFVIDCLSQEQLIGALYACPHGVMAMSQSIENFVETSTNLASVKFADDKIIVTTSQRSSVESAKTDIANMVAATFMLGGANVRHSDGYPGWSPNPESEIMDITKSSFQKLFNEEPEVKAIHAGLECGLIGEKYPKMDMISYGPTIKGAHSPDERILINTVERFWDLTLDILKRIPNN